MAPAFLRSRVTCGLKQGWQSSLTNASNLSSKSVQTSKYRNVLCPASYAAEGPNAFPETDGSNIWQPNVLMELEHDCQIRDMVQAASSSALKDFSELIDEVELPQKILTAAMGHASYDQEDILADTQYANKENRNNDSQAIPFPLRSDELDAAEFDIPELRRPAALKHIPKLSKPGEAARLIDLLTEF